MDISAKNEEKLQAFEAELKILGERLTPNEVADQGSLLQSKKLEDGLRASIYVEQLHQKAKEGDDWDKLLPVADFMVTFREEL